MMRTLRTMAVVSAGLAILGVTGIGTGEVKAQVVVEPGTIYAPAPYAEAYKVKVRRRGYRERIVARPIYVAPAPVIVTRPTVVRETRVIRPAPVVETRYVQPAPVVESRVIQPPPVVETRVIQPPPVVERTEVLAPY